MNEKDIRIYSIEGRWVEGVKIETAEGSRMDYRDYDKCLKVGNTVWLFYANHVQIMNIL